MEKPFATAEFAIDYSLYAKFQRLHRQRGVRKVLTLTVCLGSALAFLLVLLDFFLFGFDRDLLLMQLFLFFALALLLFSNHLLPKLRYKGMKTLLEAPRRARLYPGHYTVESSNPQYSGKTSIVYKALHKAYEREEAFYLYINKFQASILPKASFTEGALSQLRAILQAELGEKFKK